VPRRFRTDPHRHPILLPLLIALAVAMLAAAGVALWRRG
jgi:hypothetical protein